MIEEHRDIKESSYWKKQFIIVLILFLTASYCTLPLFIHQGLPMGHDMVRHIFRAEQFSKVLGEGNIIPRWTPDANNGYGSPTFIFYSPLFYYFVSAINFIVRSLIMSMVIAVWSSFFLPGITMFMLSRKLFGEPGSLLSAVAYQIFPFHLIDLYTRAAFTELCAFLWLPMIILFIHKTLTTNGRKAPVGLCVSYAGLILTHLKIGFMFTFVIGAYLVYNYFLLKNKKPVIKTLLSLALGLGLSSFYLVPVIFEWKFVHLEYIVNCFFCDFRVSFLMTWSNLEEIILVLNTISGFEVILFLVIIFLISTNYAKPSCRPYQIFFIIIFMISFFLTTPLSRPAWDYIPLFPYLQFPWRWLLVMEFSLCLLIGSIFSYEERPGKKSGGFRRKVVIHILIIFSIISFIIIVKNINSKDDYLSKTFNPLFINLYMDSTNEYIPKWTSNIGGIMSEKEREKVSVISGDAEIDIIKWKSEQRTIIVDATTPVLLRVSSFYYPGWEASLDGNRKKIMIEKQSGAMLIEIPRGEHMLELKFKDTTVRYYAKLLSMISLFVAVFILLFKFRSRKHNK